MELKEIPVKDIERSPFQQREKFDEDKLQTLADSIAAEGIGLVQPIKVRPLSNGKYQLYLPVWFQKSFCGPLAQPGRAPRLGRGGRRFESDHPDH